MRAAVAYLSTENLLHNLNIIKKLATRSKILAMVKANAYGHGLRSVALRLQPYVDLLGVASIDEALQLRQVGIDLPIVLMEGIFEPEELQVATKENFIIVFHTKEQITWFTTYKLNSRLPKPVHAWLKLDTGMGRLGLAPEEALAYYQQLDADPLVVKPLGIISHLACADQPEHYLNQQQIISFDEFINKPQLKYKLNIKSLANSAAIFNFPQQHYDLVRPGLALYGCSPLPNKTAAELFLKPVMTLKTKLIAIKKIAKNSSIGYGAEFVCERDLKVGIVAMGYGDGYPRINNQAAKVLLDHQECRIIGKISMDLMVIDLSNCVDPKIGDQVTLWGEGLPIEAVAKFSNRTNYELITAIQHRVRFVWV